MSHLSTVDVVEYEVKFVSSLEGVVQTHQERVLDVFQ